MSGQDTAWVLTAGMPLEAGPSHPRHPGDDSTLDDEHALLADQAGSYPGHQSSPDRTRPQYISSTVARNSPPHSPTRSSPRRPSLQQQQEWQLQHGSVGSKILSFSPGQGMQSGLKGSLAGQGSRAFSGSPRRSPLDRGGSRTVHYQQGSGPEALSHQGSKAIGTEGAQAGALVRGRSRGLGSKERLWGAAEGSGVWPLQDSHATVEAPGEPSLCQLQL